MKTSIISVAALMLCLGWAAGCAKKQSSIWESIKSPEIVTQLKSFVAQKEVQANAATNAPSPEVKAFFAAAGRGDWLAVSNAFMDFRNHAGQYERLPEASWQAVLETWGALDAFGEGNEKYSALFAKDIIQSIPPGSIYFGGTDPGQLLITAMQKDQAAGDPFFTIPPHELTDAAYLNYLRAMYGGKIHTPAAGDLQKCSEDYTNDVVRRLQTHQLKPGEQVAKDASGQVRISGYMATIEVRALMTKLVFDQNSNREFYVEESFPLDWMYPHLEPHGIIFKLNRQPLTELSDVIVQRDQGYWMKLTAPMIGGWLKPGTPIEGVAAFAEKLFAKHDFSRFTGDPQFVQNDYSCKMFSKERSSIAGLYAWRAQHATDPTEKQRMADAADFAFRQSWALCPYSPETVVRYVNLLFSERRFSDALVIAQTAADMPEMRGKEGSQIRALVEQIKNIQRQAKGR